jgi:hypothetical protein
MPQDQDIPYFEGKARQCFRLASGCTDQEVTARLRQLGYEFVAKALMLGGDRATMPADWFRPLEDR